MYCYFWQQSLGMVVKLHSKFAEVQYVELLLKKLTPQVCFMCPSELFSRFWQNYFNIRHACGNWILCVMRIFLNFLFSSKTVFYENFLQILSKKIFWFLKTFSAGLAILHANSFDEHSDVIFWRESTLIKVSSFEEKEQKLFDSTQNDLHFFENCILFFPTIICVFLNKNINS